jgi:hypothetical protein
MPELIHDSGFATWGQPGSFWGLKTHSGVAARPTVVGSTLHLDINGAQGANWHVEVAYAPLEVRAGDTLAVSFQARATKPFSFSVWLGLMDPPYSNLAAPGHHFGEAQMGPDWQRFEHTWHVLHASPRARLNFVLGPVDNHIELATVRLQRD